MILRLALAAALALAAIAPAAATPPPAYHYVPPDPAFAEEGRLVDLLRQMLTPKPPPAAAQQSTPAGNDTCRWANDRECDEPGIGTGACRAGTDYSDCWRLMTGTHDDSCEWANDNECDDAGIGTGACVAGTDWSDCRRLIQGIEDDSCEYAKDGVCDEPRFGGGSCVQGSDRTDCGDIAYLRFQDDSCDTAFNGICGENLRGGSNACVPGTDRSDCLGRERPMTIDDHLGGYDDRTLLDDTIFPWSVIGTVDTAEGSCTATLVAENVIATAAHCIEDDDNQIIPGLPLFATGYGRADGPLTATVTAYLRADTRAAIANQPASEGTDWLLLRLDEPLGSSLGFIPPRATNAPKIPIPATIDQAGYGWDTGGHLAGHRGCHVLILRAGNVLTHDCDTTRGDSGSPLILWTGDQPSLLATDAAYRLLEDEPALNVAARADAWLALLPAFAAGTTGTPYPEE